MEEGEGLGLANLGGSLGSSLLTVCLPQPLLSAKMQLSWEGVGKRSANGTKVSSGREGRKKNKKSPNR